MLVARYARTHGPFTSDELRARYGVDASAVLRELERAGELVRGELRPVPAHRSQREWCDVEVLRRLRRASLAALRKEIEPAERTRLAAFLPAWQGVDRHAGVGAGVERLREVLVPLQGLALPAEIWERDVLPRRTGAYSPTWLDSLCASGEVVWVGAGPLGRTGRVALYFREDAAVIGPPPSAGRGSPDGERRAAELGARLEVEQLRARLAQGPCFFSDLLAELDAPAEALREALWDLVWAGEATNDAWAPLRAPRLALARSGSPRIERTTPSVRSRFTARRSGPRRAQTGQVQGRWSLTAGLFQDGLQGAAGAAERRRTLAELLLERYGIVTREQVLAEGVKGGFALLYDTFANLETLGVCRRGYFLEGMGGAQFALPGAVERLRATRTPTLGAAAAQAGAAEVARADGSEAARTLVLAAADPAQPYGGALPWPKRAGQERRPARVAGAYVVLVEDEPVLYVERGGRGLVRVGGGVSDRSSADVAEEHLPAGVEHDLVGTALRALADAVRAGRVPKLSFERIDGEPAISSALAPTLVELGFHPGPRRLTLSA
jgi:ATP-dependent Lhr-like helicase